MSNIYVNQETGKKIKLYKQTIVHVYDDEDPELNFSDTEESVARWCYDSASDFDEYDEIKKAYDEEDWGEIIELTQCRYSTYQYDYEWVVEELPND